MANGGIEQKKETDHPVLLLLLAVGVALIFYITATLHGTEGHVTLPNFYVLDALSEAQVTSGNAPAPNGFRVPRLYSALLRLFDHVGLRNKALWEAAFAANLILFALFVFLCHRIAKRISPTAATGLIIFLCFNGYLVSSAMALRETTLFLALMAGFVAALLAERVWISSILLALITWCRPEGALLALGVLMGAIRLRARHEYGSWRWVVCGIIGVGAAIFFHLATNAVPASLVWKRAWMDFSTPNLWLRGALRLTSVVLRLFFGIARDARALILPPLLGGLLALLGLGAAEWQIEKPKPLVGGVLFGAAVTIVGAAFSPGSSALDPTLPWLLAIWIVAAGLGIRALADLAPRLPRFYPMLLSAAILFEAASFPFFLQNYAAGCASTRAAISFLQQQHQALPADASVGITAHPGLRLLFPERVVRLVPPRDDTRLAALRHPLLALEVYKHNADLRFDYWVMPANETNNPLVRYTRGERIAEQETGALAADSNWIVCRADWSPLVVPATPIAPDARSAITNMRLVARVDVGYPPDESQHGYRLWPRLPNTRFTPVVGQFDTNSGQFLDVGELVIGGAFFSFPVLTHHPLRIVIRTATRAVATVIQSDGEYPNQEFAFQSLMRLQPVVNGRALRDPASVMMAENPENLSEVVINIPAEYLDGDRADIALYGDHVAYAYWFYQ